MSPITLAGAFLIAVVAALLAATWAGARMIERRYPPVGAFATVDGIRIHHVHVPGGAGADLPPIVFIHGASANLNDQMVPLRPLLEGRAEMVFFDRPGHGWSDRGGDNGTPQAQARLLAGLLDRLGVERAVIAGHSFGGAIAAAFALDHPERTAGLIFLSAATHPWEGGRTSWYYELSTLPLAGRAFTALLALPVGWRRLPASVDCVFAPNPTPPDYSRQAAIPLVLRPSSFIANAVDVQSLYPFALGSASRYREIRMPTVVISGDSDTVVYEEVHSLGLARDIPGAELVWISNLGHKPDWIAPELVVAALEKFAGRAVDLQAAGKAVEARVAGDIAAAGCRDEPAGEFVAP